MSQDLFFSEDEDAENFGNHIRALRLSPFQVDPARVLDEIVTKEMIEDKKKPREDILTSLQSQQPADPYAEFNFDENLPPIRKIRSPEQGFAFFTEKTTPKTPASRPLVSRPAPYSTVKRSRLLKKYTPLVHKSASDDEEVYISRPTRRPRTAANTPTANDMITPQNTPASFLTVETGGVTPRRANLRPRKLPWVPDELLPLAALREAYLYHRKEREEKAARDSEKSSSRKKRQSEKTSPNARPNTVTRKRSSARMPTTPRSSGRRLNSKRRLRFDVNDSDDEETIMSKIKRMRINQKNAKQEEDDDSDNECLMHVVTRLKAEKEKGDSLKNSPSGDPEPILRLLSP